MLSLYKKMLLKSNAQTHKSECSDMDNKHLLWQFEKTTVLIYIDEYKTESFMPNYKPKNNVCHRQELEKLKFVFLY